MNILWSSEHPPPVRTLETRRSHTNTAGNCDLKTLISVQNFLLETKANSCYCNKLFQSYYNYQKPAFSYKQNANLGAQVVGITRLNTKVNNSDVESNSRN